MRIFTFLLFGLLLGCVDESTSDTSLPMNENWLFFPCTMGDDQAFIYLNVGIVDTISDAPQSLAELRLKYKSPHPNGLPTNEEFEAVKEIEDRIESYSKGGGDWYVGRATVGGHRIFHIYTSRDEESWKEFVSTLCIESGYDIKLSHTEDPKHLGYHNDLYPTKDDWQVIGDLRVIENLEENGDDGSESRKIDHFVYFPDKASSVEFVNWAEKDRFTEEPEYSHATDEDKYCVRLFHNGTLKLDDITSHTIALRRKAVEYGGDYDGWETPVMKPEDNK